MNNDNPPAGTEQYIYFKSPTIQDSIELANWFAAGGFKWLYSGDGHVRMVRTITEDSSFIPLCEHCGVPAMVNRRNHSKDCKTRKEDAS